MKLRHWPVWMGVVFCLTTIAFASMAIIAIRRQSGVDLPWSQAVLWQGLIYGSWWPFAWIVARIVARLDLKPILIAALYPAWAVYVFGHALLAAWIDYSFGASGTVWRGWLHRLPIDVLIATAITAMVIAVAAWRLAQVEAARAAELNRALDAARAAAPHGETPLLVSAGSKRVPVAVVEVEWFGAAANYVVVNWNGREGLVRETLTALLERLDPVVFARAHRSAVVNLARVASARALVDGSWVLTMASGAEIVVSRTYRDDILKRLGRP
ncbi:LytTR family DNA-binding domain-containing protein [Asticcacaulis sp. AC402]|uniref:LytTR family DNA-binding domain-containing protein n=1 Tax=Asticcacaulis sp. AC402 TaxID=1282361 RepID=UPI0003C3EC0D|nr:LytTR family DNA-binding domain-containing protein [Asticcacaulis sp. AC402]ESQ77106.1 hypothetical protein ABAC402_01535 [Asticcacaulis sp. AC402]